MLPDVNSVVIQTLLVRDLRLLGFVRSPVGVNWRLLLPIEYFESVFVCWNG